VIKSIVRTGAFILVLQALAGGAAAAILMVGPGRLYELPSGAALAARPGDTVRILPGRYADCAVWRADGLVIEGRGRVTVADEVCEGKALFVITGNDVTVRGITFTGAHNRVHNGAGIRAEGAGLRIENSRFIDNDEGLLAGANQASVITVVPAPAPTAFMSAPWRGCGSSVASLPASSRATTSSHGRRGRKSWTTGSMTGRREPRAIWWTFPMAARS